MNLPALDSQSSRSAQWWLCWILLGALALRLIVQHAIGPTALAGDEIQYFWRGAVWARGGPPDDMGVRPPAMELLFAGIFRIFGVGVVALRTTMALLGVALIVPLYQLACRLGGPRVGLWAALLAALYPTFIAFSHYLWSEMLYTFLILIGLEGICRHLDRGAKTPLVAAGFAFGLSALTRVVGLGFPLLAAFWLLFRAREGLLFGGTGERLRAIAAPLLLLVAVAAPIVPWTIYLNGPGEPFAALTRTTWLYLYIGNAEPTRGMAPNIYYEKLGDTRIEREAAAREVVIATIAKRMPWWPFEKLASEVPGFFTPTSFPVRRLLMPEDDKAPLNRPWSYKLRWQIPYEAELRALAAGMVVACYLAVVLAGSFGIGLLPHSRVRTLLLIFVFSQIAPVILTFAVSRFRVASMAIAVMACAWLGVHGRDAWRQASVRRRVGAAMASACVLVLIALRWHQLHGNAWA